MSQHSPQILDHTDLTRDGAYAVHEPLWVGCTRFECAQGPSASGHPRIVNIKGDTKPADRCDVETLKGASVKLMKMANDGPFHLEVLGFQTSKHIETMRAE